MQIATVVTMIILTGVRFAGVVTRAAIAFAVTMGITTGALCVTNVCRAGTAHVVRPAVKITGAAIAPDA